MRYPNTVFACLLLLTLSACYFTPPEPAAGAPGNWPNRRALFQELEKRGQLLIVYPASQATLYQEMIDSLKRSGRGTFNIFARSDAEVSPQELANNPLALVGAFSSNRIYGQMGKPFPIQIDQQHFTFADKVFTQPEVTIKLFPYPSPFNREMPLLLFGGNGDQAIVNLVQGRNQGDWSAFFWSNWGFEVAENGINRMIGYFDDQWQIDPALSHDFTAIKDTTVDTKYFHFVLHQVPVSLERMDTLMRQCEQSVDSLLRFLGADGLPKKIEYHLYPSSESKGLQLFNTQPAHTDDKNNKVYAVFDPIHCGEQLSRENKLIIRQVIGAAERVALETGLSVWFAPKWHTKGADYWSHILYQSGNLPELAEVLDNEAFKEGSPLVFEAVSAVLVQFLLDHWGKAVFFEKFRTWSPAAEEVEALQPAWEAFLANTFKQPIQRREDHRISYLRGFNFAHEGYRIHNGYGSETARNSLQELEKLGTNAIALVPYSYMSNPKVPVRLPIMQHAGSETDESVVTSFAHARTLGMSTVLKPQIWMRGSWPGEVEMPDEDKWEQFFDYYYRWMRHYALLAEMENIDMLCVGVEFSKATQERPDDWRQLIRKLRGIYTGPMTYAANWGEEFEQLSFWDELDYIGLNCYYPLSKNKNATPEELKAGFAEVIKKAEAVSRKYNKQLIFTEIGFRSTEQTWINPHEDANGRTYDAEAQRECYEIVFQQIQDQPWCNGILWWKWPSYLDYRGEQNTGFTPNNKPAEMVVKKYFGK